MDCERFERVVLDLLYEELDELTAAAARRHLEHCVRCRGIASGLRATRQVGALPLVDPPHGLELRILEAERRMRDHLPLRQRVGRAVSVLAGYAMRPQLAMAALLLLAIGSSLVFLRARPGDRDRVLVTERAAPEGESEGVAILPARPLAQSAPAAGPRAPAAAAEAKKDGAPSGRGASPAIAGPAESDGNSAYDTALGAFRDSRYGEARRQFEDVAARGGTQAAEAALYAAQAAKNGEGCAIAAPLFDQVPTRYPGTRAGYDATWQAAVCYEALGDAEQARRSYQALLDDPTHGERAKTALAVLDSADQKLEVAARKAKAPAAAKAGASPRAEPGSPSAPPNTTGKELGNPAESR